MKKLLHIALPDFGPLDVKEHNRRLQAYRRWAWDQKLAGRPVTCWCLYLWLAGNRRDQNNAILRTIRKPMQRPSGSTSNEWQGWKAHRRNGGTLSFAEYLSRRARRSVSGQGARTDLGRPRREKPPMEPRQPAPPKPVAEVKERRKEPPPPRAARPKKPAKVLPFAARQSSVPRDEGLRMEPASIVAKINRLLEAHGISPKGKPC